MMTLLLRSFPLSAFLLFSGPALASLPQSLTTLDFFRGSTEQGRAEALCQTTPTNCMEPDSSDVALEVLLASSFWPEVKGLGRDITRPLKRALSSLQGNNRGSSKGSSRYRTRRTLDQPATHLLQPDLASVPLPMVRPEITPPVEDDVNAQVTAAVLEEGNGSYWASSLALGIAVASILALSGFYGVLRRNRRHAYWGSEIFDAISALSPESRNFEGELQSIIEKFAQFLDVRSIQLVSLATCPASIIATSGVKIDLGEDDLKYLKDERDKQPRSLVPVQVCVRDRIRAGRSTTRERKIAWLANDSELALVVGETSRFRSVKIYQAIGLMHQVLANAVNLRSSGRSNASEVNRRGATSYDSDAAGRIAHEFSNLLTSIRGYAEMANDCLSVGNSPRKYLERIQQTGDRARGIVDSMLDQRRRKISTDIDVVPTLQEIIEDIKILIPPNIDFQICFERRPLRIVGEPQLLQQILINLCKNSGEAMHTSGTLNVSVSGVNANSTQHAVDAGPEDRFVCIAVSDTGAGISPDDLTKVFKPYFSNKVGAGGTGLGLAVVKDSVERLGGTIYLSSTVGLGTTVNLYFPLVARRSSSKKVKNSNLSPRAIVMAN